MKSTVAVCIKRLINSQEEIAVTVAHRGRVQGRFLPEISKDELRRQLVMLECSCLKPGIFNIFSSHRAVQ